MNGNYTNNIRTQYIIVNIMSQQITRDVFITGIRTDSLKNLIFVSHMIRVLSLYSNFRKKI